MNRRFAILFLTLLLMSFVSTKSIAETTAGASDRDAGYNLDSLLIPVYPAPAPITFSWIDLPRSAAPSVITSVDIGWNVDANSFEGVRGHLVRQSEGEPTWISGFFDIRRTGDDDNDQYAGTSKGSIAFHPPESVHVHGSWELHIEDSQDDDNPFHDVGRLDRWEIQVTHQPPHFDLVGKSCKVPRTLNWGDPFVLIGRVRNDGSVGSIRKDFVQKFYLSRNRKWRDGDDILLGTFTHSGEIGPAADGAEFRVVLRLPTNPPEGYAGQQRFYVGMRTDADSDVDVAETYNNGPGAFDVGVDWDYFELPTVSIGDARIIEGDGETAARFDVTLSKAIMQIAKVRYITSSGISGGIASAGTDYVPVRDGWLTFAPNETTRQIAISVNGDVLPEPDETFRVHLVESESVPIADPIGIGTIVDDDGAAVPKVSIGNALTREGDTGNSIAAFPIRVEPTPEQPVTIRFRTVDDTAVAGADYLGTRHDERMALNAGRRQVGTGPRDRRGPGNARIELKDQILGRESGERSGRSSARADEIKVQVIGDTDAERDEIFYVEIVAASNAEIDTGRGVGIIRNDDVPTVSIQGVTSVTENLRTSEESAWTPTTPVTCMVRLSGMSSDGVVASWTTREGSALANRDYIPQSGVVTFDGGTSLTRTIEIEIYNDGDRTETDEVFYVDLDPDHTTNANVDIENSQCEVTIRNN